MNIPQYSSEAYIHPGLVSDKPLPSSIVAEQVVIGAVLLDNSLADLLFELIDQNDLYLMFHKHVFQALRVLWNSNSPLNAITVGNKLREIGLTWTEGPITSVSAIENEVLRLRDGLPRVDGEELKYYAKMVKSKAILRSIILSSNQVMARAFDEDAEPESLIAMAEQQIAQVNNCYEKNREPLIRHFGDFVALKFAESESVGFEIRRRELCLIASITNRGKSTMLRNAAIAIATGSHFVPLVAERRPLKVLLIDFETSGSRLQDDLTTMTRDLPVKEKALLREKLFLVCEAMVGDEILSLSHHLNVIERAARVHKVDVIMIDTASAAFDLRNENDNGEVARLALKPLLKLARKLDCGIVLAHHIGKIGSEEARQVEKAYRARGASAWGCYPTSVYIITAHPAHENRVALACAKRKDGPEYEKVLELSRASRWFSIIDETSPPAPRTSRQIVRAAVIGIMKKAEILYTLKETGLSERTIEDCLGKDVKDGFLMRPRAGWYSPTNSATSALSNKVADVAELRSEVEDEQ